jgi:hypothetical protein
MMRKASKIWRPFLARGVSGTAPTIYLRSKSAASAPQPASLRPTVYALQRFAKAQLQTADAADQAKIEADIARYQSYLDGDLQPLFAQVSEQVAQKKKLIPLLDRYPDMPLEKLPEIAEVLQTRLDRAYNILRKDVAPPTDVDEQYFETSKFQVLKIYTGCVATIPDGDIPPGAVEMLPGQCIHTTVNGEDVMLEVDEIDEGFQMCWFKPEIPLPEGAEVLWSYPHEPTAATPSGTQWDADTEILAPVEEAEEDYSLPSPPVRTNVYAPMVEKLEGQSGDVKAEFSAALLNPGSLLPLDVDYAGTHDREVVEAKRDRYYSALLQAESAPPLMLDALQLELEHVIIKSQLVDELRTLEYKVAGEQLLARIHERRLEGEYITELEALDYNPHARDDFWLDEDFGDHTDGRYIWTLYPQLDGDEELYTKPLQYMLSKVVPREVDPLSEIMVEHMKGTPQYKALEQQLMDRVSSELA